MNIGGIGSSFKGSLLGGNKGGRKTLLKKTFTSVNVTKDTNNLKGSPYLRGSEGLEIPDKKGKRRVSRALSSLQNEFSGFGCKNKEALLSNHGHLDLTHNSPKSDSRKSRTKSPKQSCKVCVEKIDEENEFDEEE